MFYINDKQFREAVKRAFVYGLIYAPFFEECFTKKEQQEKFSEVVDDCINHLSEQSTRPDNAKAKKDKIILDKFIKHSRSLNW